MVQAAIPRPDALRAGEQRRDQVAGVREPVHVEGGQYAGVAELRRPIARRLAQVKACAAGREQRRDLSFAVRDRCRPDLDPGGPFEIREHRIRQLVGPVQKVELACRPTVDEPRASGNGADSRHADR